MDIREGHASSDADVNVSRIIGVLAPDAHVLLDAIFDGLSHGSVVPAGSRRHLDARSDVALGATDHRGAACVAEDGGIAAAIDGAIYNRAELGEARSNAELILDLYRRYGFAATLQRLNGDFAIALYDSAVDALWLGRDRLGVKPLYYVSRSDLFAFASRPRPLLSLPGVSADINRRFAAVFAASHYRYFDNRPEESPYQHVAQLPAAHWLKLQGKQVTSGRYWTLEDRPDWEESEEILAEQYRSLLLDAVRLRANDAVRPAFTLSGGMDSSSVLACAVHLSGDRQHAFSTVYADRTFDESDEIRSMLDHSVREWHPVPVDAPDVFGLVARMVEAHDEPVATATWLAHYVLCREAARGGFGSLFGGLGGDELNAGEYEHFFYHFADLRLHGREGQLRQEIAKWVEYHDHPVHRKSPQVAEEVMGRVADREHPGVCVADPDRMRRYYGALDPDFYDLARFVPVMEAPFSSYLKTRTFQDLTRETAPCCLRAEDRQTVAFGLDNYVPFFDHRLVEFMFRVPGGEKIRDGVTKTLLRNATKGVLPEVTRTRIKKTGWNAPAHLWFSGKGRTALLDLIHSRVFRERGIYSIPEVLRLAEEHEQVVSSGQARENHMMFFWQLVNLELWLQSLEG